MCAKLPRVGRARRYVRLAVVCAVGNVLIEEVGDREVGMVVEEAEVEAVGRASVPHTPGAHSIEYGDDPNIWLWL